MTRNRKKVNNIRQLRNRNNQGVALLELVLAISVGVIVTTAAFTMMLLGLRMFTRTSDGARHRNQVLTGITVMENLVADHTGVSVEKSPAAVKILAGDKTLLTYDTMEKVVFNGSGGAPILEDVEEFSAVLASDSLLRVTMTVRGEEFSIFLFARDSAVQSASASHGAEVFLAILRTQLGSDGRIVLGTNGDTLNYSDTYYSEWYIGGYTESNGWTHDTAWCSCFVSWGLEQSRGFIQGTTPKYASVNSFKDALIRTGAWKDSTYTPQPGDLIFFNWDGGVLDHVGVVEKVENGYVYTIEGNSGATTSGNGSVRQKHYSLNDPRIAGYGLINWIG